MELALIFVLMGVWSFAVYALDRRFKSQVEVLSVEIRNLEGKVIPRLKEHDRRMNRFHSRVDTIENYVANKALQSRYPGLKELDFHVEEGGTRGYVNEVA